MNIWYGGVLRTSKKVLQNAILGPTNHFNHSIFKLKKKFFFKIWGSKKLKNNFFGLWDQKMIFGQNSQGAYVPCTRNLGTFGSVLHTLKIDFEVIGAFFGCLLGVERRKTVVGAPSEKLGNFKNVVKKNLRYSSIFWNFQLRCTTKTR